MRAHNNNRFWMIYLLAGLFLIIGGSAGAQDLYVSSVTVTPAVGQAGDTATIRATIGNNGPGMALVIQLRWFLSADNLITMEDMALGDVETLYDILYEGQEITIDKEVVLPPFQDGDAPSYLGLMLDPYEFLSDGDRSNNTGATAFTYTGGPLSHSFFDPSGDNYLDVTHISAEISGNDLHVKITFREPPPGTAGGFMAIDLDQNPVTGLDGLSLPGAEAVAGLLYTQALSTLTLHTASGIHDLYTLNTDGNCLSYSIPLSLLNNDTDMDLFWAVDSSIGATSDFDRAPDVGGFATDTDMVIVRRPGDTSIQVDLSDPVTGDNEPDFPNVKRLQAEVVGDQLEIVLTYNHQVENLGAFPGDDGLFVWIHMDTDHKLSTGFKHTGQQPPSFGIDYELRLQIDPLAGTVAELLRDNDGDGEAEAITMGLPFNDLFMRLSGDRIICRVPLGYLGFNDGGGVLAVSNLNTRDILTGTIDNVPDSGAWDLKTDRFLPGQKCSIAPLHLADPSDDSIGAFGYDNDELVGLDICSGDDAFLFTIDYKSYLLSNDGATLIYLDTDQDTATGWEITNIAGDTRIGADYIVRTYWYYDELLQITKVCKCLPPEQVDLKNQLTTVTLANRIYVTVPFECIGSPTGKVNILVHTASWGGGPILLPNDDLPNHGVITLSTTICHSDFNNDGDVDGSDLAVFATDFGQTDYVTPPPYEGDFGGNGDVNGSDLAVFAMDFGRTDCPQAKNQKRPPERRTAPRPGKRFEIWETRQD